MTNNAIMSLMGSGASSGRNAVFHIQWSQCVFLCGLCWIYGGGTLKKKKEVFFLMSKPRVDHISWLCVGLTWLNPDYGWLGLLKLFHGAPRKSCCGWDPCAWNYMQPQSKSSENIFSLFSWSPPAVRRDSHRNQKQITWWNVLGILKATLACLSLEMWALPACLCYLSL